MNSLGWILKWPYLNTIMRWVGCAILRQYHTVTVFPVGNVYFLGHCLNLHERDCYYIEYIEYVNGSDSIIVETLYTISFTIFCSLREV